jgi:hypothetical protein
MATVYATFDDLPKGYLEKMKALIEGGDKYYKNNRYMLQHYCPSENTEFLTTEQKLTLFSVAASTGIVLKDFLKELHFWCENIIVTEFGETVFSIPTVVEGVWPPCNSYGGLDCDGRIHM